MESVKKRDLKKNTNSDHILSLVMIQLLLLEVEQCELCCCVVGGGEGVRDE